LSPVHGLNPPRFAVLAADVIPDEHRGRWTMSWWCRMLPSCLGGYRSLVFSSTSWCPESSVRSCLFPYKRQGPVTCSKVPALARSTSTGGISGAGTSCRQRRRWIIAETKGDMEVLPSAAGEAHDERATVRLVCSVCRVHEIHVSSVNEFVTAPHRRCNKKVHKNLWLFCFRRCTNKQSRAITRRGPRRLPFPRPRARSAERGWLSFPGPARWSTIAGRQPGSRAGVH
jgi:hypothetical protein